MESQKSKVDHAECRSYLGKQNLRPGFEVMLGSPSISLEQDKTESFSVGPNRFESEIEKCLLRTAAITWVGGRVKKCSCLSSEDS